MLETLATFDRQVFHFINVTCANSVTDLLMPQITSDLNLRIAYLLALLLILWKGNREWRWLVLGSIIALALSDLASSALIKPLVERPRPCHTLTDIHLLVNCGGGFSLPSSHAANAFAQWVFWSQAAPKFRWYLFTVAFLVAISRVFVGVHYPGDIIVGGLVGAVIGGVVYLGVHRLLNHTAR
jgi:undecaprenyl-diphosphatase